MNFGLDSHIEGARAGSGTWVEAVVEPVKDFSMRVLVQNPLTLSYYLAPGMWTRDPEDACAFSNSQEAINFCVEQRLFNLQIVLKFPDDRYDIELPILVTREGQLQGHQYAHYAALSA